MKAFLSFLKTTVLGGLLVFIPLFLIYLVLEEAVDTLIGVLQPIAGMLPGDWVTSERQARFLALDILLALFFVAGVGTRTRLGIGLGHWMVVTGEHRGYDRKWGVTASVKPRRPFNPRESGWGAVELA